MTRLNPETENFGSCSFSLKMLVEIGRSQKSTRKFCMPTPQTMDINWRKILIETLAIHMNYRFYRLQGLKYKCGKCSS